jgi:hypothetical protein
MRLRDWLKPALILFTVTALFIPTQAVQAISIGEYFRINYSSQFSQTSLTESEIAVLDMSVTAVCTSDVPMAVDEAQIVGRVVAVDKTTGARTILIPSYTIEIKDFPTKAGELYETSQSFTLQFPSGSESGKYTISGETTDALVKMPIVGWMNVTSYLPRSITLGTIDYTANKNNGGGGGGGSKSTPDKPVPDAPGLFALSDFSITPQKVKVGENVTISARIKNVGNIRSTLDVVFRINGVEIFQKQITLDAGADQVVSFTTIVDSTGSYVVTIGEASDLLTVEPPESITPIQPSPQKPVFILSSLELNPANPKSGEIIEFKTSVINSGEISGGYKVEFKLDGISQETREVTLNNGEKQDLVFHIDALVSGEHTVSVNNLSTTFKVIPSDNDLPSDEIPDQPKINYWLWGGLIVLFGIVFGIVAGVVLSKRKL